MNVVGKVSSFITQGMYSVATPFHPFGGAVDIIVVKQNDGTFRSTPWYVRFGKFQGVLKGAEKIVRIEVNGVEANFHMYLDNSGEAYFFREVDCSKDVNEGLKDLDNIEARREDDQSDYGNIDNGLKENGLSEQAGNEFNNGEVEVQDDCYNRVNRFERVGSDSGHVFYEFQDEQSSLEGSLEFSEYGSSRYDTLDSVEHALESQNSNSEVVLVSVDGHILTAPISSSERNGENVQLSTPQFHLGPGGGSDEYNTGEATWTSDYLNDLDDAAAHNCEANGELPSSEHRLEPCEGNGQSTFSAQETRDLSGKELCCDSSPGSASSSLKRDEVFKSCLELSELALQSTNGDQENVASSIEIHEAVEDPHGKSPQSTLRNVETENGNHEILRIDDDLSTHECGSPISVSLPELHVETATCERNTADMDFDGSDSAPGQFVSNNQELQEQKDVNLASEDECSESEHIEPQMGAPVEDMKSDISTRLEISLCGNVLHAGMGWRAAEDAFEGSRISTEEFKLSAASIVKNENLVVRLQGKYLPWSKAEHIILGMAAFGLELPVNADDVIPVEVETPELKEDDLSMTSNQSRRWRLWPIPFRRVKTLEHTDSNASKEDVFLDSESVSPSQPEVTTPKAYAATESPRKQIIRTNVPTTDQIASLNLKEGQNMVNFVFSTRVLGTQKVEAHIYLWKWNTRIVISDVDGTITKSDVLGQFMPLVGKDWTHSGIARLFSAIKENGYQLLFLSARAIVQAYLTKSFLFNLKQDGKSLPNGPVVISPDGLFPSLYREVIRRAPHEFKIACLEDIKALFPPDYNPFYAGFGNRDTDELSYRKIGIPKGKIFIINPKGEVAINHCIDVKSYTSLHTLVNDMFPPTSLVEQEDYNSWNYWKMPLPDIDNL
ncbi:Protein involved in plasmid maintenance/nuclear protein involved in lipid metabolism [Handroanthus impetiginosus]|uniref:phosphatidate phosphatase n=1 Tax=Handroanthus impetiginosus TaxID=429701 RepID=A0A2G9GF13_9LAMI|nr:Protein involved in plasmid maintenance/nuclear protein involved in lipid metabolism [Handroanthus impetiginosus]